MNHIYFGLTLSLICLFLAYFILPKFLLVTVLCVILAVLFFKDDFILFRYIATQLASFYSWICDFFLGIQNMYHQSNNTNFPIRKSVENNGALSRKFDRLQHGSPYNLSTSFVMDNKPLNSGIWDSGSKFSSPLNSFSNRTQSTLQEMSKLNISHHVRGENSTSDRHHSKSYNSSSVSPLTIAHAGYSRSIDLSRSGSSSFPASRDHSSNIENKPPLSAKLYADVSSPGFCGRVADRLHEESMTHQSKYDSVGAFPVVNLKSQSPKIKIKTPVRVRLAPPSNELVHYNYGANLTRPPVVGPDDSMKSVLQVLKEISRKRIHSHIDEDSEESTKRLRVTDSQFDSDGLLHTSLLQQTIQGKRAREESSPNEDDKKRHKASLKNNEILSSLSSSISIRPPHLQSSKRKAQSIDDSITSTPVLGKLLKVQTEITPPALTNHIAAPDTAAPAANIQELTAKISPLPAIPSPIVPPPAVVEPAPVKSPVAETLRAEDTQPEDGAVSRLLGRMSDQTSCSRPIHIPVKKNVFMSTNDLSLSPPKENRLAAMIAVLGGPSEQSELENIQSEAPKQPERLIKGKALFTSPESPATPETPKQNKKVTFSDSLTTTKVFERDEPDNGNSAIVVSKSPAPPSTPLSSFSTSANTPPTEPKLNFGSENTNAPKPFALTFGSSPLSSNKETPRPIQSGNFAINAPTSTGASSISSPGSQTSMFQMQSTGLNFASATSSASVSGPAFPGPAKVSSSNLVNTPSPGGFSFGTNSSLTNTSKESFPKQNTSPTDKPFSFGSESKTSQPATSVLGFPSLFSPATPTNEIAKATDAGSTVGQNKPMFNIFGNKGTSNPVNKSEGENKPLVNGFAPPSSNSSPFALSQPINQANTSKPPSFASHANPTTTSQSASPFGFGSKGAFSTNSAGSSTTQPATSSIFVITTQQSNLPNAASFQPNSQINVAASPSLNMFSSSTSSPAQNKPGAFGSGIQVTPAFGDSIFKPVSSGGQNSQANSVFGSTPTPSSGFGSSPALQNGAVSSTSGASQNNNMFGSMYSTANKPVTFGSGPNTTTQPSTTPVFGFSGTTASTQASSPFGITANNSTSNTPTMFGNTTTAQSTSVFGNVLPSTASQSNTFPTPLTTAGQTSLFGSIANNDASKNIFAGASNATPTFGGLGSTSSPAFGNQSNSASTFGGQNTTAASTFGNQSAPAFSFGNQNNTSNPTQGGFGASGTFGGSSSNSSTNEVKPPAFGSGSPFAFGSPSASKPTEAVKPLGTATPFAFGSSAQQSSATPQAQPPVPRFGAPTPTFGASQPTPTFGGGSSQPAAPTFGGGSSQPAAPSFGGGSSQPAAPSFGGGPSQPAAPTFGGGSSQPAAPTFQFGQASSATAAPAFQFNAAPPTVGGGMFSIGSGGSSTSRTKTTALRRNKRT